MELLWLRIFCDNNFKRKSSSSIIQEVLMKNSVCVQNFQRIKKEREGRLGCLYFHTIEKKGASTIFSVPFCHTKARLSFSFLQEKNIMPFLSAVSENGIFGSYGMSKLCIDGIFHFCFIHFQKCSEMQYNNIWVFWKNESCIVHQSNRICDTCPRWYVLCNRWVQRLIFGAFYRIYERLLSKVYFNLKPWCFPPTFVISAMQ